MGLRNPSRLSIDPDTDVPYTAWVGPDAGAPSATLGPSTYENAAQVDRAGNYGWPYCMANKQAYRDRIADSTPRETNAPGYVPGGPANGGTNGWYDCDNLINDSIRNDGLRVLPHTTGTGMNAGRQRPVNLWTSRGNPDDDGNPQTNTNNGCPDFPRERGAENAPNYGAIPTAAVPVRDQPGRDDHERPAVPVRRERDRRLGPVAGVLGRALVPAQPRRRHRQARRCCSTRPPTRTAASRCTRTACATR